MIFTAVSLLPLGLWAYLLFGRGWFWLCRERDGAAATSEPRPKNAPDAWPSVVAIIPARDEADMIADSVGSLLRQDYPGRFSVVVVDDQSSDGTAAAASRQRARPAPPTGSASLPEAARRPAGRENYGPCGRASRQSTPAAPAPEFVLFTDADIAYSPHVLGRLVAIARASE